jgi:hypothetical protein
MDALTSSETATTRRCIGQVASTARLVSGWYRSSRLCSVEITGTPAIAPAILPTTLASGR